MQRALCFAIAFATDEGEVTCEPIRAEPVCRLMRRRIEWGENVLQVQLTVRGKGFPNATGVTGKHSSKRRNRGGEIGGKKQTTK